MKFLNDFIGRRKRKRERGSTLHVHRGASKIRGQMVYLGEERVDMLNYVFEKNVMSH